MYRPDRFSSTYKQEGGRSGIICTSQTQFYKWKSPLTSPAPRSSRFRPPAHALWRRGQARPGQADDRPYGAAGVVDNTLDRQFNAAAPNQFWVTGITYVRTFEGFSYLAVIIDLYSRKIVGWAMQSRQPTDLVLQALLMAAWRRKPAGKVLVHSDQGSQFTSTEWASFLKQHNLE